MGPSCLTSLQSTIHIAIDAIAMTTSVHFAYTCHHVLKLEEELVPTWLIKEFFGGVEYDPNTWQGVTHDYGTIPVDDLCGPCKEEASRKRRRNAGSTKRAASKDASSTATPPSATSEKSNDTNHASHV